MISANANINLTIYEGATYYQEFTWMIDDLPVDLTGFTAKLHARDLIEDLVPALELTDIVEGEEGGGIVILSPPADGKYAIFIPPSVTDGLCPSHEKRVLVYDLFFYAPAGLDDASLQQGGKITIIPAVTRT